MKRKILAALLSVCLFVGLAVPAFAEDEGNPPTDPVVEAAPKTTDEATQPEGGPEILVMTYTDNKEKTYIEWCFIANGLPLTITQNAEDEKRIDISYTGEDNKDYVITSPQNISSGDSPYFVDVYGGNHNGTEKLDSTSVTVKSGKFHTVTAGGLHGSIIGTATTVVENGSIANVYGAGVGYSGYSYDSCRKGTQYDDDKATSVDNARVTMSDGNVAILCGGGMGYGYVQNTSVTITGGKINNYCSGSGTNGYTENAVLEAKGGTISELYGVVNGKTKNVTMQITGDASVAKAMHAASDDVGVLDENPSISLTIDTKGTIGKLTPGFNGAENPVKTAGIISGKYNRDSVKNYNDLLTKEEFGTAFAKLLPIEETTKVDVSTDKTDPKEIQKAVADATKAKVNDGTIQNGDTVVAATAKAPDKVADETAKNAVNEKITNLLGSAEKVPAAEKVQKEIVEDKTITYLVTNLSEVEASEDGKLQSVTFDVTPYEHEVGSAGDPTAKDTLDKAITFYLPIPDEWTQNYVDVWHNGVKLPGSPLKVVTVENDDHETIRCVKIISDSFSPFKLAPSNYKPPVSTPSYSSGGVSSEFYVTVIAGANGKAKEAEGFYARDERHTFTMIPDEGYVIDTVTLDDGSVLSHTDTEFVLFVDEPYEVHVTFKKAAGSTAAADKPAASKNPQTSDSWFSGLF